MNDGPTVLRFPKGSVQPDIPAVRRLEDGVDVLRDDERKDVLLVAVGPMADLALKVADGLAAQGIGATVVDPRWVVPVPKSVLDLSSEHRIVVTIEDGIRVGGIGTRVRQDLREAGIDTAVDELGLPDSSSTTRPASRSSRRPGSPRRRSPATSSRRCSAAACPSRARCPSRSSRAATRRPDTVRRVRVDLERTRSLIVAV